VQHGLRTIAFCKTRKMCELVTAYTRETLKDTAPHLANTISVYRAGYSPEVRIASLREMLWHWPSTQHISAAGHQPGAYELGTGDCSSTVQGRLLTASNMCCLEQASTGVIFALVLCSDSFRQACTRR